ncbi:MAG: DUF1156 domain-containing protein [Armatimonadetes bacterium]|nr:DUF1156 domain-containing protein [Armatimonadota bacterium]
MPDNLRLIEKAFLLRQVSLDSVHEKNVRHGHISTLHIWPARRPLAACRAAIIATLLDDPGNKQERDEILKRMAGELVTAKDGKEETKGGILHWKRETENQEDLTWFRAKIREKYGRSPRVLDPFAGGGAIPLEAMRLGCETTAIDINPVAWFVLKCTLDYPYRFAGKLMPLPEFVRTDTEFLEAWCAREVEGKRPSKKRVKQKVDQILSGQGSTDADFWNADLSWHVRAWGRWVLSEARKELAPYYPTYAEWQPVGGWQNREPVSPPTSEMDGVEQVGQTWLKLVPCNNLGVPKSSEELNLALHAGDLADDRMPRWVVKPTVVYFWGRTVQCQNSMCRATIPLLKTRLLVNKADKQVYLDIAQAEGESEPRFKVASVATEISGTVGKSGAKCVACGQVTRSDQIRYEGRAGRLGTILTAVACDGLAGKEYRLPTSLEKRCAEVQPVMIEGSFDKLVGGYISEPLPDKEALGIRIPNYGFDSWEKLFSSRQVFALSIIARKIQSMTLRDQAQEEYVEAMVMYMAAVLDKLSDYSSAFTSWHNSGEKVTHTFVRFAFPIVWDYVEAPVTSNSTGSWGNHLEWVARYIEHGLKAAVGEPHIVRASATELLTGPFDAIITDPPYYDAIPYSDLMDFFYVWLRRTLNGLGPEFDEVFKNQLSPKWDEEKNDGELIDDASRFGGDREASKRAYEDGMRRAFERCRESLTDEGRLVVVFANKQPEAWETLISALIKAGFTVTSSWPIETEMGNRTVAQASAALASSVWIVCRKRHATAKAGWDTEVLQQMNVTITARLREFWDMGIRGPDFVWSAVGPALEEYSRHPVVKKTAGQGVLSVKEFLEHVRRIVVDFVVGRVFSEGNVEDADVAAIDDVTAYYLLHRHDFGFDTAPIGACILYAISCGTTDTRLAGAADLLVKPNKKQAMGEEDESDDPDGDDKKKSNMVRLKRFNERTKKDLGEREEGEPMPPLIDRVHRLMLLWKAGDQDDVNEYVADMGLQHDRLFLQLMQALVELARRERAGDELQTLEAAMNHLKRNGTIQAPTRSGEKQARPGKKVKVEHPSLFDVDELSTIIETRKGYGKKKK